MAKEKTDKRDSPRVRPVFFDPTSHRFALVVVLSISILLLAVIWAALFTRHLYDSSLLVGSGNAPVITTENVGAPIGTMLDQADIVGDGQVQIREDAIGSNSSRQNAPSNPVSGPIWNAPQTEVFAFVPAWSTSGLNSIKANFSSIDVVLPEWYGLSQDGVALVELAPEHQSELRDFVYTNRGGKRLLPVVRTGVFLDGGIERQFGSVETVQAIIGSVVEKVHSDDLDGVCFDFTGAGPESSAVIVSFATLFKKEMANLHRESCLIGGMSDALWDHPQLNDLADRLIVLGFQEPGPFSTPSPLAPQDWFDEILADLATRIDPDKLIVGIGSFGFDWVSGASRPKPVDFFDVTGAASAYNAEIKIDPLSLNTALSYIDAGGWQHHVWLLDALSTHNQMLSIASVDVGGIAVWPGGHEDPGVWALLDRSLGRTDAATLLKRIEAASDVRYDGKGALLTISKPATNGERTIAVSPISGLIIDVEYTVVPSAFTINRDGYPGSAALVLSFDDGPSKEYTPKILDILNEHKIPAVFFVVGKRVLVNPEIARRILSEGHEIGVHTYSHPNLDSISDVRLRFELHASQELLASVANHSTPLFRAPYGIDENPKTPSEAKALKLISEEGYVVVGIDVDSKDWTLPGTEEIVQNVLVQVKEGAGNVILMHDAGGDRSQTVEALGDVIKELKANGFTFVTLASVMDADEREFTAETTSDLDWLSLYSFHGIRLLNLAITSLFFLLILAGVTRSLVIIILALFKSRRPHESQPINLPVTVAIPAFCEETVIAATIQSVLASNYPNLDVIVIDDGSTDETARVVQETFKSEPRVRLVTQTNQGKAEALNYAFRATSSSIVVAIDADTVISPDAIGALVGHFHDPEVGAVAGNVKVGNRRNLLTRLQAIEYIASQNLDRRAFEVLNGIMVVPGSIGAWRKSAVEAAGGYTTQTLVEDADATVSIIRAGFKVVYEPKAHAYTEAPETIRQWMRQRLRWNFGMLQIAWKHKGAFLERRAVGLVSIPDLLVFGAFVSLFAPIADFVLISNIIKVGSGLIQGSVVSVDGVSVAVLVAYLAYLLSDLVLAALALSLEPEEDKWLLAWALTQRFFYRQIQWFVALRSIGRALTGRFTGWRKITRTATVSAESASTMPRASRRVVGTKRHADD